MFTKKKKYSFKKVNKIIKQLLYLSFSYTLKIKSFLFVLYVYC